MECCNLIQRRNQELGFIRFDHGDVLSHPFFARHYHRLPRIVAKCLRVPEALFPLAWRRLLGVEPTLVPVTLYHLGMYHLIRASIDIDEEVHKSRGEEYCYKALDIALDSEHVCWEHPYEHHGGNWKNDHGVDDPLSCAHHTARLGYLLLHVGRTTDNEELGEAGVSAARALLAYHNWHQYEDGSCTVSYYPNTEDEVINTAAEVASLLAALPPGEQSPNVRRRLEGIVRMVLREQREDGSWLYCTREHYRTLGGNQVVDNHHSAMVLHALAEVADQVEAFGLREDVVHALQEGISYYLNEFVGEEGRASYFPSSTREAGIAGYCEGIIMLAVMLCRAEQLGLKRNLIEKMDRTLYQLLDVAIDTFLDRDTGDVASYTVLGYPVHLQSIRLGSGLLMEAIVRVAAYSRFKVEPDEVGEAHA